MLTSSAGLNYCEQGDKRPSRPNLAVFELRATMRQLDDSYLSSVTGSARKLFGKGKLFGLRETTPPAVTRDLPITLELPVARTVGIHGHLEVAKEAGSILNFINDDGWRIALKEALRFLLGLFGFGGEIEGHKRIIRK
jgi:hypothetical protein